MSTPEQDAPPPGLGGHYGDHVAETAWAPSRYATGPLVGAGRWMHVYAPVDDPPVGLLYTNDDDVLGWYPADAQGSPNAPGMANVMAQALLDGAALGVPARVVFDAWAERNQRGLMAGTVTVGDLRDLPFLG